MCAGPPTILLINSITPSLSSPIPHSPFLAFTIIPSDVVIARGSPALFNCSVTSTGFIFLTWQKDGLILSPSLPKYTYFTNNSLQINPTEIGDNGTYYCVVTEQETLFSSNRSSSLAFACEYFNMWVTL